MPVHGHDLHVAATNRLVEALAESEHRMRRRLDLLADVVVETDEDGLIVFVNRAWSRLTGHDPASSIGQPLVAFFPPEYRSALAVMLSDGVREVSELLVHLVDAPGRHHYIHVTKTPIEQGGAIAVLRDVTADHAYQEELRKLSVVASATSNLVVITDVDGLIDWVNPAFEHRTGYSLDEVRGRKPGSFLQGPGTDQGAVARVRAAVEAREPITEELLNYARNGDPYWITLNLTPVFDAGGRLERYIAIQTDTTERRRIERMKTEFVSTVSHELRTPLTSISGSLGLLEAGAAGELSDRAQQLVQLASRNSSRLTAIINDLLDMERLLEGGLPLDLELQPLTPIVERAIVENQAFAEEYDVHLRLTDRSQRALVTVDPLRLIQVLSNLVSNACKFSPPGSAVDVVIEQRDRTMRLTVIDRGPGIPESFRSRIFEKFSQADGSDTRRQGGTGLGLAITKELVERMGGSIGFDSVPGRGCAFVVTLPVAR